MDIISYILSRKYVDMSIVGLGSIKGANCTVKDIVHQDGINTVTFEWTGTDGTKKTRDMVVYDGTPIYVWESGNTYHYGDLAIYESQFYRCIVENNDATFDSTKWNEIGSPDGNYDIVQSVNLLPARFTAADRKLYYVIDENCFYLWNGTAWVKTISNKIADLDDVNLDDLTEGDVLIWDSVNEKWVNKAKFDEYKTAFTGTEEEWNALTSEEQNVYDIMNITNDGDVLNLGVYLEKKTAMPVASEDVEHKIYLYTGTTTQNYKKGVVYQCVSDGQDPATYSWVALIDFGTAALKNSTDRVSPNNTDLVESQSVYSAINTALSSIYSPRGDITCAELTSSLLIAANVGNVYETSDSGTTTALFLQGAGHPIATGDNVGIINAGEGRILFNLMANAFDLTSYQKKDLTSAVEGQTTVEGALGALSTNKQSKELTTAVESATTVESALGALSTNKQAKTLSTSVESQTTVEGALGALSTNKQSKTLVTPITVNGANQTTVEGALGSLNDNSYYNITSGYSASSRTIKISGFSPSASSATGETYLLRSRGKECIFLTIGQITADLNLERNYNAFKISGDQSYSKISNLVFDYTNKELYLTVGAYAAVYITQIGGVKNNLSITTENVTVPTDDVIAIPIKDAASLSDLDVKADKVTSATNGDLASLDANGNLVDSGVKKTEVNALIPKRIVLNNTTTNVWAVFSTTQLGQNYLVSTYFGGYCSTIILERFNSYIIRSSDTNAQPQLQVQEVTWSADGTKFALNIPYASPNISFTPIGGNSIVEQPTYIGSMTEADMLTELGLTSYTNYLQRLVTDEIVPSDASASNQLTTQDEIVLLDTQNAIGEAREYGNQWCEIASVQMGSSTYQRASFVLLIYTCYNGESKTGLITFSANKASDASAIANKSLTVIGNLKATDFGADVSWNNTNPTVTIRAKVPSNYDFYRVKLLSYEKVRPVLLNTIENPNTAPTFISSGVVGGITSTVASGSTASITSGGVYNQFCANDDADSVDISSSFTKASFVSTLNVTAYRKGNVVSLNVNMSANISSSSMGTLTICTGNLPTKYRPQMEQSCAVCGYRGSLNDGFSIGRLVVQQNGEMVLGERYFVGTGNAGQYDYKWSLTYLV